MRAPAREVPTIDLGIAGRRVPVHSHIAYLWSTERDFERLSPSWRSGSGARITASSSATKKKLRPSWPCSRESASTVRPSPLRSVSLSSGRCLRWGRCCPGSSAAFEEALSAGAPLVRLFGNVGWDRETWPPDAELAAFEAHLNEIADKFDSVLLCLHQLPATTGLILRYGVLGTHPTVMEEGEVLPNPLFIPLAKAPDRLLAVASDLSNQQVERKQARREAEILQAIFDNIPVMVSFRDSAKKLLLVNQEWERVLGWTLEEARQVDLLAEAYPDPEMRRRAKESLETPHRSWENFRTRTKYGATIDTSWSRVALSDGTRIGFGQDITERLHAEERMRQSAAELRALSERLRVVREEERTRMARDVHDEVGQALTALRMDVAWLERRVAAGTEERAGLESKLRSMSELIDTTLDAVQRIATELRPGVLDELGLEAAIEWYVREFEKRTGVACSFRSELDGSVPDPGRSTAVFRILQEALTNMARHSEATRARIDLFSNSERLRLEIRGQRPRHPGGSDPELRVSGPGRNAGEGACSGRRREDSGRYRTRNHRHAGDPAMTRILLADDHDVVRQGLKQILMESIPETVFGERLERQGGPAAGTDATLGRGRAGHLAARLQRPGRPEGAAPGPPRPAGSRLEHAFRGAVRGARPARWGGRVRDEKDGGRRSWSRRSRRC